MDAERQRPRQHGLDSHIEILEVAAQDRPTVNDQEHIAVSVVETPLSASLPVRGDGVDSIRAEIAFTVDDHGLDLGKHTVEDVGGITRRHASDVGCVRKG